jgi:hypothetical protein
VSTEFWKQVPRRPRYQANAAETIRAEVDRSGGDAIEARLHNLSRTGFQLQVPVALMIGEAVRLQLHIEGRGLVLSLPSTVQWQRPAGDDTWLAGCQCEQPVDWESLGELFLNGILSQDGS